MMCDQDNMGERVRAKLKWCGEGVIIYPMAKIVKQELVEIGDHTIIEDFAVINGGQGVSLGRYVNISAFSSVFGGGRYIMEDYAGISEGARMVTATTTCYEGKRMNHAVPHEQRNTLVGTIYLERDTFVGANSVVHPNVRIGRGAIIGSNSLVLSDVEPWSINVGSPCKKIGERPRVTVPDI